MAVIRQHRIGGLRLGLGSGWVGAGDAPPQATRKTRASRGMKLDMRGP